MPYVVTQTPWHLAKRVPKNPLWLLYNTNVNITMKAMAPLTIFQPRHCRQFLTVYTYITALEYLFHVPLRSTWVNENPKITTIFTLTYTIGVSYQYKINLKIVTSKVRVSLRSIITSHTIRLFFWSGLREFLDPKIM